MHQSHKAPKRPTIGFFVDNLFDSHEEELRRNIMQEAAAADANLLCFLGGPAWGQRQGKVIYELAGSENVDGIIALSGCLDMGKKGNTPGCFEGDLLETFFRQYAPLPIVSINKRLRGTSSILIENEVGIRELLDHLIDVHRRERIAFIRGPILNDEANARFDAYRAALDQHGLPYEPARVVEGDFSVGSGVVAVGVLLDERHVDFDAIVGANDYMAIDALQELQRRGIKVPEDVAVGGFDDIRDAISIAPALTTVGQPLREMAKAAMKNVLAMIRGETVPEVTCFPTEAIIRRSCGCLVQSDEVAEVGELCPRSDQPTASTPQSLLAHQLETLFPWVKDRVHSPSWAADLAGELFGELEELPGSRFLAVLDALLVRGFEFGVKTIHWRRIVKTIFGAARRLVAGHLWDELSLLREHSLQMVGDLAARSQALFAVKIEQEAQILQHVFRPTGVDEEEIRQALQNELPKMGIGSFYLVSHTAEATEQASLAFHYSHNDNVVLDTSPGPYPSKRLVPGRFTEEHRYAYAVLPVHSSAEQLGFALCELSSVSGITIELLVYQLGRAVKASALMKEVKRYASELEARVEERTRQLSEAQQQLMDTAHQAGMAEIAVGVIHNVGNLLNSVSVSAEGIARVAAGSRVGGLAKLNNLFRVHQGELAQILGSDSKVSLIPDYCGKLAETLEGERRQIQTEAEGLLEKTALIRETIQTLQEYARDGKDLLLTERIDLPVVLEAAVKIQAANASKYGVEICKRLEETPPIIGQRAKVVHVLVNLFKNAIEAMQSKPARSRYLTVELSRHPGDRVMIRVSDTGDGISKENLGRIFSYGFTTKPDGHGFGLHICANYVNQMGGNIAVASEGPGKGATFTLVFKAASTPSTLAGRAP